MIRRDSVSAFPPMNGERPHDVGNGLLLDGRLPGFDNNTRAREEEE